MTPAIRLLAGAILMALSACASAPPPAPETAWTGGDPARLAADKADCRKEVEAIDVQVSAGYSDPRYGVTSAMAAYVDKDNPLADRTKVTRDAAFVSCMTDKGWKPQ